MTTQASITRVRPDGFDVVDELAECSVDPSPRSDRRRAAFVCRAALIDSDESVPCGSKWVRYSRYRVILRDLHEAKGQGYRQGCRFFTVDRGPPRRSTALIRKGSYRCKSPVHASDDRAECRLVGRSWSEPSEARSTLVTVAGMWWSENEWTALRRARDVRDVLRRTLPTNAHSILVRQTPTSSVRLARNQAHAGYSLVILREHVTDLPTSRRAARGLLDRRAAHQPSDPTEVRTQEDRLPRHGAPHATLHCHLLPQHAHDDPRRNPNIADGPAIAEPTELDRAARAMAVLGNAPKRCHSRIGQRGPRPSR